MTLRGAYLLGKKELAEKFGDFDLWGSLWTCVIHWGRFSFSSWLTRELVLTLPTRGFHQIHGDYLLHNSRGGCHYTLDPWGSPFMILYITGDFFENLNSQEFFWWLMDCWGMLLMLLICCGYLCGLHVFYPTKGSLIILTCSWIFLLHFLPPRNPQEILRDFFFFFDRGIFFLKITIKAKLFY